MVQVSVITPVRDGRAFLGEAIASVQAQTVQDWEMLIVDDGSTDGSAELAAAAARADPRIRLVASGARRGAAAARNAGIRRARGDYIALLDADDLFEPEKLRIELAAMAAHPTAALVYGPTLWWWPHEARAPWLEPMHRLAGLHQAPELFVRVLVDRGFDAPCTCGVLMRRAAVAVVGGFEEAFSLYEDQTLWAKLMLRWPVHVHGTPVARYRQHPQSTSAQAERAGRYHPQHPHAARAEFLSWAGAEARAAGLGSDGRLQRALRLAMSAYPGRGEGLTALDRGVLLKRRLEAGAARLGQRWPSALHLSG
jgi:glycosyltransferase involved in cell wall biosynthesis